MKLLEFWKSANNEACKIVVKRWWGGVEEYYTDNVYNTIWRNSKGRRVFRPKDRALDGLLWVAQRKEKLQLHRIAFEQLTKESQ